MPPTNNTAECLDGCAQCCCPPLRVPFDDYIMTPFVEVKVAGNGQTVSVGNNSSPPRNHAVVSSFKYGTTTSSGGCGMEVEIIDEAGSKIQNFFDRLTTVANPDLIVQQYWVNARWGWIATNCDGTSREISSTSHTLMMNKLDITYGKGVTKFQIKGVDVTGKMFEAANFGSVGTDERPSHLKDAIAQVAGDNGCDVFYMKIGNPDTDAWGFNVGGKRGPLASWRMNGNNFVQSILGWVAPYRTDSDKGITFSFNSKREPGSREQMILWEDKMPDCKDGGNPCDQSIGTYIINGGNRSPVIDFSPTMNWTFGASGVGGGMNPGGTGAAIEKSDCDMGQPPGREGWRPGQPTFGAMTSQAVDVYGIEGATEETRKSTAEHSKANPTYEAVKAELRIQGDPLMADPIFMNGKSVALIVMQPFNYQVTGDGCGEWLQTEPCNKVLSNRSWLIMGAGHEIKAGSYTTTLKLMLPAPGSNIDASRALGGDAVCGYVKRS